MVFYWLHIINIYTLAILCGSQHNVWNEEGLINGMEPNCVIGGNLYVGPAFIVKNGGDGNLYSLTDEQIQKYLNAFETPEFIEESDEDMDAGIQMQ